MATDDPMLRQFQEDAGLGMETMGREDFAIPFLSIIQSLSPQRDKNHAKFIEGAAEGMFFNSVTSQLLGETVDVVPVHFEKVWNEWRPNRGGYVGTHSTREDAAAKKADPANDVLDTANHYLLLLDADGNSTGVVLSCTKTRMKVSRAWNTRMSMLKAKAVKDGKEVSFVRPTFSRVYTLRSVQDQNAAGQKYYSFRVEDGPDASPELYAAAKDFRTTIVSGARGVDYTKDEETPVVAEPAGDVGF